MTRRVESEIEALRALAGGGDEAPGCVPQLFEVVQASKALMLVMELVPGGALSHHIQQAASISQIEALEFVERLANGTAYCHKVGVAHR